MITGSTASALYGEPRATQDIDIVIDPQPDQLSAFLDALKDGFYVSAEEASEALRLRGMFVTQPRCWSDAQESWIWTTSAGKQRWPVSRISWQESCRRTTRGAGDEDAHGLP